MATSLKQILTLKLLSGLEEIFEMFDVMSVIRFDEVGFDN